MFEDILNKILNSFTKKEVAELLRKKRKVATGKTVRSLKVEGVYLLGREFFSKLSTGQSPRDVKRNSGRTIEAVQRKLNPWARARGISEKALFPIARKLFTSGDLLFRTGKDYYGQKGLEKDLDTIAGETAIIAQEEITEDITETIIKSYAGL